jgi:pimeloyl-ACP methyl ester carboxylesterase
VPVVVANGLSFHTQVLGAGPPVVMLHGLLLGSAATWYFTAAPVLARRHRVLVYDLRGHGRSERARTGYDVATMAADLGALADAFDPEPLALVGHSFGGVIALRFALDRPERVAKIALVETPLPAARLLEIDAFLRLDPAEMMKALPPPQKDALLKGRRRAGRMLDHLRFLVQETTLLRDMRREPDISDEELRRLRAPALLVYGRSSLCVGVAERILRVLPDARAAYFDAGHFVPLEAPAEMARTLLEFLDG